MIKHRIIGKLAPILSSGRLTTYSEVITSLLTSRRQSTQNAPSLPVQSSMM